MINGFNKLEMEIESVKKMKSHFVISSSADIYEK